MWNFYPRKHPRLDLGRRLAIPGLPLMVLITSLAACGFMDLRPIDYSLSPAEADAVLPEDHTAVSVTFTTAMVEQEVERTLTVTSPEGTVEGDLHWEGKSLFFVPLAPWEAGVRYNLALKGLAHSLDGRELRLSVNHPFYGLRKGERPVLLSVDPAPGSSVSVQGNEPELPGPHGPVLWFRFSRSMDRQSVQDALTIEGVDQLVWTWGEEDRLLEAIPKKPLNPWTVYRWTLKKSAISAEGIPLGREESGTFRTDLDPERPRVERTFCLGRSGSDWVELSQDLNDLDLGQALGVRFTKPMNRESLLQALRLEPSLTGYAVQLDEWTVVYVPDRTPEPETPYMLVVAQDTRDAAGLSLEGEYRELFTPSIPYLKLLSVEADGASPYPGPFSSATPVPYPVQISPPDGLLSINLNFSLPFTAEAQNSLLAQIQLSPYFPGSLAPTALRSAAWPSDSTLRLVWEGLEGGSGGIPHYYRITLAGGRSGITTNKQEGAGYWLKESITLYLEAQP